MAARPRDNLVGYALIAPFLFFFTVFLLGPFLYSFWLSMHASSVYDDWYNKFGSMRFVAFGNYVGLLASAEFWWSLLVTLYYALLTIPTMITFSLTLAILLNSNVRMKGLFRTGFFIPQVVDLLVIGIIWSLLFSTATGAIDRIIRDSLGSLAPSVRSTLTLVCGGLLALALGWLIHQWADSRWHFSQREGGEVTSRLALVACVVIAGLPMLLLARGFDRSVLAPFFGTGENPQPTGLLDNPVTLMPVIAFIMVLKGCGLGMILFLTTIQQIPRSVYEAAECDGATARQQAFLITLPLVRPIVLFLSITGLMATLNAFTEIYAITQDKGGPVTEFFGENVQAGQLTGYMLWVLFREQFFGRAAALSFIMMVVALLISAVNVKFLGGSAEE